MRKIVIDIYGADDGITPVLKGVASAVAEGLDFMPILVGNKEDIDGFFAAENVPTCRYEVINTNKFITNNDPPTCVFGGNDDASLVMAFDRLKTDDDCVAMLSPGNTGAMLVGSICRLGLISKLKFPALSTALPCLTDKLVCLVDCGANTECTAKDLARFAELGNIFSASFCGIEKPRVGLLSVGREDSKGTALTKEAFALIKELPLNFIGNIEGSDLVSGYADVVVSDGFAGNVLLKNTESVGKAAIEIVKRIAPQNDDTAEKIISALLKTFDFNSQGGATFLGTKKIVVKAHGCANDDTINACIKQIIRLDDANFNSKMQNLSL